MYAVNGSIQGGGTTTWGLGTDTQIEGSWRVDERDRICFNMRHAGGRGPAGGDYLPPSCQFWYRLGDLYFVADSDSDRRGKVLQRTLKQ
jgi:hypothetical protein